MKNLKILFVIIIISISFYTIIMSIKLTIDLKDAKEKLKSYQPSQMILSYGNIEYLDRGDGEVLLVCHGIFGGFDQGYESLKDLTKDFRILSPSRFGYLNSDVLGKGTPEEQCKAYIVGTSAGGTVAIRFALDYPNRCKGLILYSSAMPETEKPKKINLQQAPPNFLCNNLPMYLISPFFKTIMGMESNIVKTMLPIDKRRKGVKIDGGITNPDMAVNYDNYNIEEIEIPTLIFQSKDDKITKYEKFITSVKRFKNSTFKIFETGGHLLVGHEKEINETVKNFINAHK